ncbi:MAG: response regulator [Lachnospiraceae bacterium]|nr:response regulator [Lachnospiraceae bacterium]
MKNLKDKKGHWERIKDSFSFLFREEDDIQVRLLNLILIAAIVGGVCSCLVSVAMDTSGNFVTIIMVAILLISLWIVNVKKKPQVGGILISCLANMVLFPIMYFYEGGMHSGMPVWMLLGLTFCFLIIHGRICYIIFAINSLVVAGCIAVELFYPGYVYHLDEQTMGLDIIQSIIIAACVFGAIFKFQSSTFGKQRDHLIKQEEQVRLTMEELKKANQAKSDFLANMSHEIRTPINAVLGMNEMVIRESTDDEISKYAQNIESAGQNLLSLINDILDFSKIESGKMEILPVEYEVSSLLNDSYNMISMRAAEKNLKVKVENDSTIPSHLMGDEVRIRQCISNLLTNAVKYTKRGSITLSLNWERLNQETMVLKVAVKDTGIGITQENQEKLFSSFQRVDEKRNRSIEGTGLGLAITRQFVRLMGGEITLESEYGKGSVFQMVIPQKIVLDVPMGDFSEKYARWKEKSGRYHESFQAPHASVLVVDDVEMNLEVIKGLLKNTKIQIDTASSGEQCLTMIQKKKYHIIFMDHMMPEMDGVETLHEIQKLEEHPNTATPVIALTANAIIGAEEQYMEEGFTAYLAKPVRSNELERLTFDLLPEDLVVRTMDIRENTPQSEQSFLEKLSFLDIKSGLLYCSGDEELYKNMLRSYVDPKRYAAVIEMYEKEDWYNYRIQLHAVKSSSLSIGAKHLSMQAKKLEMAAKDGEIAYIKGHNESFLRNYQEIFSKIDAVLRADG